MKTEKDIEKWRENKVKWVEAKTNKKMEDLDEADDGGFFDDVKEKIEEITDVNFLSDFMEYYRDEIEEAAENDADSYARDQMDYYMEEDGGSWQDASYEIRRSSCFSR